MALAVCRFFIDTADRRTIAEALFPQLPAGCGDADTNGDGKLEDSEISAIKPADGAKKKKKK